ncbi:MAG: response regulator transcription factor [Blastochloris sp.]|nr:response regulator transcription factor [Blastochloris sp.]
MIVKLFKRASGREGEGLSVLVVSDTPSVLASIRDILGDAAYHVYLSQTSVEALHLLDTNPMPSLIICDFVEPQVVGKEMLTKAKIRHGKANFPPVLFLVDSEEDELTAEMVDASELLAKPFQAEVLQAVVQRMMG